MAMKYTVHELAQFSGMSIRTLHYYDEIGLLRPESIGKNGYRYYGEKEMVQLQQILFYKELDFSLDEIQRLVNDLNFDIEQALQDHKKLLIAKKKRIDSLLITIDKTVKHLKGGERMTNDDLYQGFSDEELNKLQEEAKERWGHTDAYKQSIERTKGWTKTDYDRTAKKQTDITKDLADLMKKGVSLESPEVQAVVERHYQYINQFYDASNAMYRNLGEMYVIDLRFTAYYDKFAHGLAVFMRDAIAYYCKNHGEK